MLQEFVVKRPDKASFGKGTPGKYAAREYKTALAVYSMWIHFLEFTTKLREEAETRHSLQQYQSRAVSVSSLREAQLGCYGVDNFLSGYLMESEPFTPRSVIEADWTPYAEESWNNDPFDDINKHTRRRRLTVFVRLSQGKSL